MRSLSSAVRERLRSALETRPAGLDALPFAEAVIVQRAWPLGENTASPVPDPEPDGTEASVAGQVIRMVDASMGGDAAIASAATELANDLALLAAFFQNLDLLPVDRGPAVDAIALLTAAAVQRLAETLSEG